jgi:hypothetical protein
MLVRRSYIKIVNNFDYKVYKWLLLFGFIPLFVSIDKHSRL